MVHLFTRAAIKTSPFSFLTSVCLYALYETGKHNHDERASLCEINNYILKAIYDFIIQRQHFAKQIEYRLSTHKEYADTYVFLYKTEGLSLTKRLLQTERLRQTGSLREIRLQKHMSLNCKTDFRPRV